MECKELFSIPIYKFEFDRHKELKHSMMQHLSDPEVFAKNTKFGNKLQFSHPNLHIDNTFAPFVNFAKEKLNLVMEDLGFKPSIQITGMWATKHMDMGSHHRHTHGNSFLAGVYYLHGNEHSSGTRFYNTHKYHNYLIPSRIKDKEMKIQSSHMTKFEEGVLWIFPSWLEHSTGVNDARLTSVARHILSFNTMPLGPTNHDEFDRYDYPQCDADNMLTNLADRFIFNPSNKQQPESVSEECACDNCGCN